MSAMPKPKQAKAKSKKQAVKIGGKRNGGKQKAGNRAKNDGGKYKMAGTPQCGTLNFILHRGGHDDGR